MTIAISEILSHIHMWYTYVLNQERIDTNIHIDINVYMNYIHICAFIYLYTYMYDKTNITHTYRGRYECLTVPSDM